MTLQNASATRSAAGRTFRSPRAGLSVLEIVGCLMAVAGGVWLGAIYLGVDVRHLSYVALSESTLMDKVPEQWRPADPAAEGAASPAELAAKTQNELAALRGEITSLGESQTAPATAAMAAAETARVAPADAEEPARQASLAYWSQLNEIVRRQAALQLDAELAATESNATKVAALKARISRYSAGAIRALATTNVDLTAVKLGNDVATWYENGAYLFDEAVQVWESPARTQGGEPVTQEWERTQLQHQNEARLLRSRVSTVRDSLARRFGAGFAPLAGL